MQYDRVIYLLDDTIANRKLIGRYDDARAGQVQGDSGGVLKPWRAAERLGDGNACPGILMPIAKTPGASPRRRRIC